MKLYTSYRAPNPRRVRWVMAEKGIDNVEFVEIDLLAGEHRTPAYRDRVGVPHVPALELDDGACISESIAICRYLEALHPEPNLFGRDRPGCGARPPAGRSRRTRHCRCPSRP